MARIIIIDTDENEHVAEVLDRILAGATISVQRPASFAGHVINPTTEPAAAEPAAATKASAPRKRKPTRTMSPEAVALMGAVAEAYNAALVSGTPTGEAVEAVEGIRNDSMASYYVKRARDAGLITAPAQRGRRGTRPAPVVAVPDLEPDPDPDEADELPPPKPVFADPAPFIKRGPIDVDAARARASEVV